MKTIFALSLFLFLVVFTSQAQSSYTDLVSAAWQLYEAGDYAASAEKYQEAFQLQDGRPSDLYNAACSSALSDDKRTAIKMLKKARKAGWINARHLQQDTDLQSLHGTRSWEKLVARMQADLDAREANYDKVLQGELLEIYEEDQGIRRVFINTANELGWDHPSVDSLGKIMHFKDSVNLIRVQEILDEHGWVGPDLVGGQANQTLFLVIQHADLEVQQKYLPMMREAVELGNARPSALALLEDRVALREGRKQIYGSQIGRNPDTNQQYVLPLEDPDNVDARRASMGLGPLADYVSRYGLEWDVEEYKRNLPTFEAWQKGD
jgi:hypothetical protein